MDVFDTTKLEELGYADAMKFANPLDARYTPRASNAAAFGMDAIQSTVSELGNLGAYAKATPLLSAESAYYANHGQPTMSNAASATQYGGPQSSGGYGGQHHGSGQPTYGSAQATQGSSQAAHGSSQATYGSQAASTQYQGSATATYGSPGGPPTKRAESKAWRA